MRRIVGLLFLITGLFNENNVSGESLWKRVDIHEAARKTQALSVFPEQSLVYTTDEAALQSRLFSLSNDWGQGQLVELPMPDGSMMNFKVWHTPIMPDILASRYPGLRTFTAEAVDNSRVTAKIDFTAYGFHAMIFDGEHTSFIDPYDNNRSGYYAVHYKKDEIRQPGYVSFCQVRSNDTGRAEQIIQLARKSTSRISNGHELLTYRLALACDHQYAIAATGSANPTIEQTLGKMVTSMNRINGVYERELSITMVFVANEDTLIWTSDTSAVNGPDPFSSIDTRSDLCNNANQILCDTRIGNANYDIGHVFTTGAGGESDVGAVCMFAHKARSSTGQPHPVGDGFDIDFVAHEMGHEFGANHTFNGSSHWCSGNINESTAYEPGSGSTIMAYAGICDSDDIQLHSDAYFHGISLLEIQDYVTNNTGKTCPVRTPTNNKLVNLPPFVRSYNIPFLTPFELTALAATDSVADTSTTYCWEQWNLGDVGASFKDTHEFGPIFRSYAPTTSTTRIFPKNSMVLAGVLSNAGIEYNQGEKVPDVRRFLTFKLTVRDIYQGHGCFLMPDDSIFLDAINTGAGFTVTSQNTSGLIYNGGSSVQITWNKVGTDAPPVNTPNVEIFMSDDGGNTWKYHIGQYRNNGAAIVTLPNPDTLVTAARIKVKGADNVFFNVNSKNFMVEHSSAGDTLIEIRPVPARSTLRVMSGNKGVLKIVVYNAIGQQVWRDEVNGELDIAVNYWARGMYFIKLIDIKNQVTIKKFVVE